MLSDEIIAKFPPTRLMCGTNDPLHDNTWAFASRLLYTIFYQFIENWRKMLNLLFMIKYVMDFYVIKLLKECRKFNYVLMMLFNQLKN